jgi:alpha-D-ribose 1-methylphosphonate 5-triphosphate synthase subunit PhnH
MSTMTNQSVSPDLSGLGAGFADPARGSQAVFRSVLHALSYPGQPVSVGGDAQWPQVAGALCHAASAAVLLALLDAETTLWLSPSLAGSAAETWLRFHTGCTVVKLPSQAQFVWAASLGELPDLAALAWGSDVSPETSATCVVDVPGLLAGAAAAAADWTLTGPGLRTEARLALPGLSALELARFDAFHQANHAAFPRGVDVLLTTSTQVLGLPRTTKLVRTSTAPTPALES